MTKTFKLEIKNYLANFQEIQEIKNIQIKNFEKEHLVNNIMYDMKRIDQTMDLSDTSSEKDYILECLRNEKDIEWSELEIEVVE